MSHARGIALAACLIFLAAGHALAQKPQKPMHHAAAKHTTMAAQAKISRDSAQKLALAQYPNATVKSNKLERRHGRLVYAVELAVPKQAGFEDVTVSAINGKVWKKMHESARTQRREQQKAKGAMKTKMQSKPMTHGKPSGAKGA